MLSLWVWWVDCRRTKKRAGKRRSERARWRVRLQEKEQEREEEEKRGKEEKEHKREGEEREDRRREEESSGWHSGSRLSLARCLSSYARATPCPLGCNNLLMHVLRHVR